MCSKESLLKQIHFTMSGKESLYNDSDIKSYLVAELNVEKASGEAALTEEVTEQS